MEKDITQELRENANSFDRKPELYLDAARTIELLRSNEQIRWINASDELPDAGMEVLVCFERSDCEERDTCLAMFDDSLTGESPWMVDGGLTHFGTVMFWAEKPTGPIR